MKIHPHEDLLLETLTRLEGLPLRLLEHVAACDSCRSKVCAYFERRRGPLARRMGKVVPWTRRETDYAGVLAATVRAGERRRSAFARERAEAQALAAELLGQPAERRELMLRNNPRFRTWGLLERLIEAARDHTPGDPGKAEELARLALRLSDLLDRERYHSGLIEDMRARAWGFLANARRLQSDLRGAEEAFRRAGEHLKRGTRELLERAFLLDLKASLRTDQRDFPQAMRLLQRAFAIFRDLGDNHRAGRSLVKMSVARYHAGDPEGGIPLLRQARELIDPQEEPRLLLSVWHNLVFYHAEAGRFMEAQGLYIKARPIYRRFPDAWTQNRRRWVQGKIARGLGQAAGAEEHFLAARDGFLAEGVPYDTALVSLELACLYAEQGRTRELKRLAEQMVPIFSSRHVHREALAALSFLRRAVEAERASSELVGRVAGYLKRAQRDPALRFEPVPG